MKILLSAFACDPFFGSDEEVGWRWALELSSLGHSVWVLTRRAHCQSIENFLAKNNVKNVRFVYVDSDFIHGLTSKINKRNHLYYYYWQILAFLKAKSLNQEIKFDLIHHVTWVSFRQPSFLGLLGVPFIFGPVAGGDFIPKGYTENFSFGQKIIEWVRYVANAIVKIDPFMWVTYFSAKEIIFTSDVHIKQIPACFRHKARVELAIGIDGKSIPAKKTKRELPHVPRLLFVGRCIGWKGMDIGLLVFTKVLKKIPDAKLTIVGDGVDKARWMLKAKELNIDSAINWLGWKAKDDVLAMYKDFDLLFYPSLRDSGGFVVLESLVNSLPVVCFKLGGPGVVIDESCGAAIYASSDIEETCARFATKITELLSDTEMLNEKSNNCVASALKFTWAELVDRVYKNYKNG